MKKLLLPVCLILLIAACTKPKSGKELAEASIKSHLDSTLSDPKSYEAISFGSLDTLYNTFYEDSAYKSLVDLKTKIQAENVRLYENDLQEHRRLQPVFQAR